MSARNYVATGGTPTSERGERRPRVAIVWDTDADGVPTGESRTWPNALPAAASPCRHDTAKGAHQHRCSRAHAELVDAYRATREAEDAAAEAATSGYATELAEYWTTHRRTTFRDYLTHRDTDDS